jgi:hypothetical protein
MTTTPMAHHVCQCCGRWGTADFVNVGTDRWECADGAACRERSIEAARRQKAARVPLAELPALLGDGTVETDDGKAWFSIDTGRDREAVNVEYDPDADHPFQVWVRSWGPDRGLISETEGGAYDSAAEAAKQVSSALAAIARSREDENRGLSSYLRATDVKARKPSWPTG